MDYNEYGLDNEELYLDDDPDPAMCEHVWVERYIEDDIFYLCNKCHSIILEAEYEEIQNSIPF